MRRGLRLSVSNDGVAAAAAAAAAAEAAAGASGAAGGAVGGDGDAACMDEPTGAQEEGTRPAVPTHIVLRRSLRAARRRWLGLTPVQRVVAVAAMVVLCMGALRLAGLRHPADVDLPVASLSAVKEQQQQRQLHRQGARAKQDKVQEAAAGAKGQRRQPGPRAAVAEPTPPVKPAAPKKRAAAAVKAGGKQQRKGTASPLQGRKRRRAKATGGKRRAVAGSSGGGGGVKGSEASKGKPSAASGGRKEGTKWARAAAAAPMAEEGKEEEEKAEHRQAAAAEEEAAAAAAEEEMWPAATVKKEEEQRAEPLLEHLEDGDALPGVVDEEAVAEEAQGADNGSGENQVEEVVLKRPGGSEQQTAPAAGKGDAAVAAAAAAAEPSSSSAAVGDSKDGDAGELPKLFYCLPNGGFNDICVETGWCIDYARRTGRGLVWGYHNYIPQVPPFTPYFTLRPIANVTQYTQAEAADLLYAERARRKARRQFRRIRIHPRRLKIDSLLGEDEVGAARKAEGNPLFINAQGIPQFAFNFSIPHAKADVVVFHKIGNAGSGMESLRHMQFSEEVKRTFLERWAQLSQPYIGLHVRSTDRSCPREKIERLVKHARKLGRSRALKGANVYLATDNPEESEEFLEVLRDGQKRAIKSFTFMPAEDETGERVPLHLNRNLRPEEKHQTNIDGFVDLLLLAFCDHFIKTCGGYGRLANHLHGDKATALRLIGEELRKGQDVNDVLAAAVERMRAEAVE